MGKGREGKRGLDVSWVKFDASQYGFYLLGGLEVRRKLFLVREDLNGVTSGLSVISGQ